MTRGCLRSDEILKALKASVRTRGRMPTLKELCFDTGIDRVTCRHNIDRLVAQGDVVRTGPRGILPIAFPSASTSP